MSDPATRTLVRDGAPPARRMRTYRLHVRTGGASSETSDLSLPVARIGSRFGNEVVLADETVSRVHLEIAADEHGYRLRDLGSTNGTFVDGYRAADIYLRPGSVIRLGRTEITFEPLDGEADVPATVAVRVGPLVGRRIAMRGLFASVGGAAPTGAMI